MPGSPAENEWETSGLHLVEAADVSTCETTPPTAVAGNAGRPGAGPYGASASRSPAAASASACRDAGQTLGSEM